MDIHRILCEKLTEGMKSLILTIRTLTAILVHYYGRKGVIFDGPLVLILFPHVHTSLLHNKRNIFGKSEMQCRVAD